MNKADIAIVVPCYNEFERLPLSKFDAFLASNPNANICFVNDASTDQTSSLLDKLALKFNTQVSILNNEENCGKALSVRNGVLHCYHQGTAPVIGFLDADLATSLEECMSYLEYINPDKSFVFASRILKIGSVVERKFSRFLFGRIIATLISNILDIKVYDTQCGCKVFKTELAEVLFKNPFISKWLFDVELFSRLLCFYGKDIALTKMDEIPVKRWVDQGASKVKLSYFFRLWYDLYLIRQMHRKNYNARHA